ncbi:response regulator transcription factor [Gymnodinialimonas sp.]
MKGPDQNGDSPRAPSGGGQAEGAASAPRSGPIGRILIVEDESNILEALSFILSRAGWDVRGHGKGEDALQEIARLSPDILVLDVMLPGRSGFDILADLRAAPETKALPVLMLTAKGQAKDREQAMALGANGFLTKPFSNAELLQVVASMGAATTEDISGGEG